MGRFIYWGWIVGKIGKVRWPGLARRVIMGWCAKSSWIIRSADSWAAESPRDDLMYDVGRDVVGVTSGSDFLSGGHPEVGGGAARHYKHLQIIVWHRRLAHVNSRRSIHSTQCIELQEETHIQPEPSHENPDHPIENPSSRKFFNLNGRSYSIPHNSNTSTQFQHSNGSIFVSVPQHPHIIYESLSQSVNRNTPSQSTPSKQAYQFFLKPRSLLMRICDSCKSAIQEQYDFFMSKNTWYILPLPPNRTSIKPW